MSKMDEEAKNIEKLVDAESYPIWKFDVDIAINALGIGILLTTEVKPEGVKDVDWARSDAKAKRVITQTIDRKAKLHIMSCKTAKEMWDKLATVYDKGTEQNQHKVLMEYYSYSLNPKMSISENIAVLESFALRLNGLNHKISDDMLIGKIMSILPQEYRYFFAAWQSTDKKDQTLANFIMRLTDEESAKMQVLMLLGRISV